MMTSSLKILEKNPGFRLVGEKKKLFQKVAMPLKSKPNSLMYKIPFLSLISSRAANCNSYVVKSHF